jgi:hypothetical protein
VHARLVVVVELSAVHREVDTNVLRSSKLSFTSPDVLDAVKYSELVGRIKDDVVQAKTGSFLTAHAFLLSVLGEAASVDSARAIVEARNVLVHHAGRVSQQYLDVVSPRSYELGDSLVVTTNYVLESLAKLDKIAQNVVMECRRKYARRSFLAEVWGFSRTIETPGGASPSRGVLHDRQASFCTSRPRLNKACRRR